ncbi:MAG: caspase family protein, partial [Pseudomonadota bacterium]
LMDTGFTVTHVENADLAMFRTVVAQFGRDLRNAPEDTTALFYYAGHAVQSFGINFLLPVDARLADQADLELVALNASSILRQMSSARNATNIVVLDACRNNPFDNIPDFDSNGLAEMRAPTGSFISYATAPGEVAFDGVGPHSPFTAALSREMMARGAPIEEVFRKVRIDVMETTLGRQIPWDTSSLTREFSFVPPESDTLEAEARAFSRAQAVGTETEYRWFLDAYPQSVFAEAARAELDALVAARLGNDGNLMFAPAGPDETPAAAPEETVAAVDGAESEAVTTRSAPSIGFSVPLMEGEEGVAGRSIEQLIAGSPLFPPIEGLPEEVWRGQSCSNCHQWAQDNLCEQATTYLGRDAAEVGAKAHPYGGSFKQNLRRWAEAGCP